MVGNKKEEKGYVKKYELENESPFCKYPNKSVETLKGNHTNKTVESEKEGWNRIDDVIQVESQLIVVKKQK